MQKFTYAAVIGVVFGLGMALGATLYLWQKPSNTAQVTQNSELGAQYPLLDPMRATRPRGDFEVVFRPLRLELEAMVAEWEKKGVMVAIQMEYLNTGSYLSINQNYRMLPASLTKVPVAMMVMHQVENGTLKMDQVLEITAEDRDDKWGDLYKSPVGTKMTLKEVLTASLVKSDNTAHKMLYRLVNVADAQELSEALNLEDLFDKEGKITAREYARLLRSLYSSSYLKPEYSQQILELLSQDQVVKFLIRGLGEGVRYAHKFGESAAIYSYLDAGIVYVPNRPYVIVVMVQDVEGKERLSREQAGEEIFERVARLSYGYVTRREIVQ